MLAVQEHEMEEFKTEIHLLSTQLSQSYDELNVKKSNLEEMMKQWIGLQSELEEMKKMEQEAMVLLNKFAQ